MIIASYELTLSILFGLLTILLVTKYVEKVFLKGSLETIIKEKNYSAGVFLGSVTTGILLIVNGSIEPAVNGLHTRILGSGGVDFLIFLKSFGQFALFYVLALFLAFFIVSLSLFAYMRATKSLDEIGEIKSGNITMALVLGFTLISFSLFVRPAAKNLLGSLVNYELAQASLK